MEPSIQRLWSLVLPRIIAFLFSLDFEIYFSFFSNNERPRAARSPSSRVEWKRLKHCPQLQIVIMHLSLYYQESHALSSHSPSLAINFLSNASGKSRMRRPVRVAARPAGLFARRPGAGTRRVVANFWQFLGKTSLIFGCIGNDLCK